MQRLYVLYDTRCGFCTWAREWLARQPAYLELTFLPTRSARAEELFPDLAGDASDELVVVGDDGGVYQGASAWVMCLYALQEYREWSQRLARPLVLPFARHGFALLSKRRKEISRWLDLASESELAETLRRIGSPSCAPGNPIEPAPVNPA